MLIIVGPEFEDIEALYPYYRLLEKGYDVTIAAPSSGEVEGKNGYRLKAISMKDVDPSKFDALVIPGGRGPERIRVRAREDAIRIVRHFIDSGKPVAAICHGPQLLITAERARGMKLTSYPGIADDLRAAGAEWIDEKTVVHGKVVTARIPDDLPQWMEAFLKIIE
ncbi:MAG: type 1 glutamine amidotransferase domain-containing protein [Fervidicoccaceae archaeon]